MEHSLVNVAQTRQVSELQGTKALKQKNMQQKYFFENIGLHSGLEAMTILEELPATVQHILGTRFSNLFVGTVSPCPCLTILELSCGVASQVACLGPLASSWVFKRSLGLSPHRVSSPGGALVRWGAGAGTKKTCTETTEILKEDPRGREVRETFLETKGPK